MTSFDDGGTPYDTSVSSSLDDDTFGIKVSSKNYPTVKYVRFNIQCPQELMFLKGDTYYNVYVAYGEKKVVPGTDSTGGGLTDADREMLEKANPLYGKKVGWQGSSSMEGAGYAGGFAKIIAEENNMTSVNLAKSGGLLISGTDKHAICQGVINLCENSTYDYIIFNGGLNDASSDRSSPLGEISQGYTAELDMTTVAGAFEAACCALSRSGKKVGYIFTHKVYKDDHAWATQYKPLMEKILKKWGIPYIDLEVLVPAFNLDPVMKELYTSNADGWHANELGYRTFYVDKITAWMKTL